MLGTLVAISAALAFGVGSVLQKVGAPPSEALGVRGVVIHILRSPTYLLGTSLDLVGFVLTAVAARQLALFAVEGILSTSVGITAVLAAWVLGERLLPQAKLAVSLMVAGLVLMSVSAAPETGHDAGATSGRARGERRWHARRGRGGGSLRAFTRDSASARRGGRGRLRRMGRGASPHA